MTSWGLTKVKPHLQIFQIKSFLPLRYPQMFLGRRQNIMSHTEHQFQISQSIEIYIFHTHLHSVPPGILLFALKWTSLATASTFTSWGEMPPEVKSNYKVQLQKQLPHIQGGERNTQQKGPRNLPRGCLAGQRNQNHLKSELLGRGHYQV